MSPQGDPERKPAEPEGWVRPLQSSLPWPAHPQHYTSALICFPCCTSTGVVVRGTLAPRLLTNTCQCSGLLGCPASGAGARLWRCAAMAPPPLASLQRRHHVVCKLLAQRVGRSWRPENSASFCGTISMASPTLLEENCAHHLEVSSALCAQFPACNHHCQSLRVPLSRNLGRLGVVDACRDL